jgi:predicted nucleic acid-binding protein
VSGFLLDTNVISEIARPQRDRGVVTFLDGLDDGFISVITIHELGFGLERLAFFSRAMSDGKPVPTFPDIALGPRRRTLTETIERFLALYQDRLLPVGVAEARAAAILRASRQERGRTLHLADALIAATALANGLTLATRNSRDFDGLGLSLFDPWSG